MTGAQVAVTGYRPDWWRAATTLLIHRVRRDASQVSADPRSRRRRTLHPGQRALPIAKLGEADTIYGYSFILTNIDVSTKDKAAAAEYWYRHRTSIENVFRDSKHGAGSGTCPRVMPTSTPPGCGARSSPPAWPPGYTSSPPPKVPPAGSPAGAPVTAKP